MLVPARFERDMTSQPTLFKDEPGGAGELADVFAQEAQWFVREDPVRPRRRVGLQFSFQQFAFDLTALINLKKVFVQAAQEKFIFPWSQRRADSQVCSVGGLTVDDAGGVEFFL